jgi:hypothetical protein
LCCSWASTCLIAGGAATLRLRTPLLYALE